MRLLSKFSRDECGFVLSAEMVLLGTLGVVGATVGLTAISQSVSDELSELSFSLRSLDQSFSYPGTSSAGGAWTAGSSYTQPPVNESIAQLKERIAVEQARQDELRAEMERRAARERDREENSTPAPQIKAPSSDDTPQKNKKPQKPNKNPNKNKKERRGEETAALEV